MSNKSSMSRQSRNTELPRGKSFRRTAGALLIGLALALSACSGKKEEYVERPVEVLYNEASDLLAEGLYKLAAEAFDEVERQHPYSIWATRAQVMSSFSYYEANEYDQAIIAAERFIQLHPGHKDTPYVFYLMAISYYEQIVDVGRDQKITEMALHSLKEILRRYPSSEYARDARLKIDLAFNHLAGKEMEIGRFYLSRGQFAGAINRFRIVIEKYQTADHVPEALHRLNEAYLSLGVNEEAQATAAVLGYNFPGSPWYRDSYALLTGQNLQPEENEGTWIGRTWKKLVGG